MAVVEERVEQADGDRLHVVALDEVHDVVQLVHPQRLDHGALRVDPLRDLEAEMARHQHRGPILEQIVEARPRRPAQLEDVTHPAGGDECRARALALE